MFLSQSVLREALIASRIFFLKLAPRVSPALDDDDFDHGLSLIEM